MESERLKLSQDMVMVVMVMEDLMEAMVGTEAMVVMDMERERLKPMLSQDMVTVVMVDMVMEDLMEAMVVTEVMVAMDMERERLKLNLDIDMEVMEDMAMADPMAMVDTEAMEDMVMDMVVMDMEDLMEVMVDTEAIAMVVMVMESDD